MPRWYQYRPGHFRSLNIIQTGAPGQTVSPFVIYQPVSLPSQKTGLYESNEVRRHVVRQTGADA